MNQKGAIKSWAVIVILVIGVGFGIAASLFGPRYFREYMPEILTSKDTKTVQGIVVAKLKKDGALLLTVNTSQGALLATFKRKVDEIALLVETGDRIEFTLYKYLPFIDDPSIKRVTKGESVNELLTLPQKELDTDKNLPAKESGEMKESEPVKDSVPMKKSETVKESKPAPVKEEGTKSIVPPAKEDASVSQPKQAEMPKMPGQP